MKRNFLVLVFAGLLAACTSPDGEVIRMKQLQLLLVESAALAAMPQPQAREKAAVFARRAMSGPEMNAMHHEGKKMPGMQITHDLGDAVFALLEVRGKPDPVWRSRLLLAAQAAWMRLTGSMQGDALGRFSYSEGRQLAATQFMPGKQPAADSAYAKAARHMIDRLNALASGF